MHQAGFKTVLANDTEPLCRDSYIKNFPDVPFHLGTVGDLKPALLRELSHISKSDEIDLVFGGPPCPPFSKSRFYRKEKPRGIKDPHGFETITGYMRVVQRLKPKMFLLENVPGFAYKVHDEALVYVSEWAERLGYQLSSKVLDAADYGVPQHRQRFFLVGSQKKKFQFPEKTHTDPKELDLFTSSLKPWITAGEAIGDLDTDENADDEGHYAGGQFHNLLELVPPGDNYLFFTKERGYPNPIFKWRSRYWSFLLKLSPNLPSWTIQARRSNNMGPFHWRNRILRIEEVRRLQSFPDSYKLAGKIDKQWKQVGNAVPPQLAMSLGMAIRAHLISAEAK
jgi:DNA (cytosine-5)-methyltransferase 1